MRARQNYFSRLVSKLSSGALGLVILVACVLFSACVGRGPFHAVEDPDGAGWVPVPAVDAQISDGASSVGSGARDHCTASHRFGDSAKPTASVERTYQDEELLFTLGFVDVDDQGHFWSEAQVGYVVDALTQRSAAVDPLTGAPVEAPVIFVLYVPGWSHSAWACDTHVRNFRRSLEAIAKRERVAAGARGRAAREVRGLYLGWPGKGDFLARRAAADRAGRSAGVALLARMGPFLRELRDDEASVSVLVGQSLGAAVLNETVAAHFLTELAELRGGESKLIEGPADLVLYLNPAFEASRFSSLARMWEDAQREGQVLEGQTTQLVIYQTQGDRATESLFASILPLTYAGRAGASEKERSRYEAIGRHAEARARDPREQFGCVERDEELSEAAAEAQRVAFYERTRGWQPGAQPRRSRGRDNVHCGWVDGLPRPGDGRLFRFAWDTGAVRASHGHSDVFNAGLINWVWDTLASLNPGEASAPQPAPGPETLEAPSLADLTRDAGATALEL